MDDIRFGAAIRAARIRRGWRQTDLAKAAAVSGATVSRLERGHIADCPMRTIRAIAASLEIGVEVRPRSRGADLDRLVNARHAALSDAVVAWLGRYAGWEVRPEVSYSWYGERGVVDLVAWHVERSALLEIELKTAVVDVGELLGTLDRRRRLGRQIAESLGWEPASVSTLLVVAESGPNRRRIRDLHSTFDAALPEQIVDVRRYLRCPDHPLRGLIFFANHHQGQGIHGFATPMRVRTHRTRRCVSSRTT